MESSNNPMDTIKTWQKWYREHNPVASLDVPMATKDSRENLHDTVDAIQSLCSDLEQESIKRATACFADTIAEYASDLSGAELYKCFCTAAIENLNYANKEYKKAKQLVDLLRYRGNEN